MKHRAFGKPKPPIRCYVKIYEYPSGTTAHAKPTGYAMWTVYKPIGEVKPVVERALEEAFAGGQTQE